MFTKNTTNNGNELGKTLKTKGKMISDFQMDSFKRLGIFQSLSGFFKKVQGKKT